jgi:DNA-binding transcriptional ArsR family regulator
MRHNKLETQVINQLNLTKFMKDITQQSEDRLSKTSNVVEAIYVLMNYVEEGREELLVSNIKTVCLSLLKTYYSKSATLKQETEYLASLIGVLHKSGSITDRNYETVMRGIVYILDALRDRSARSVEIDLEINETNLQVSSETSKASSQEQIATPNLKDIQDKRNLYNTNINKLPVPKATVKRVVNRMYRSGTALTNEEDTKTTNSNNGEDSFESRLNSEINSTNLRQTNRRTEILSLLSTNPISINDIASKIKGCSSKTIQRELNSLLQDKLILKSGDKRWSRYYLPI